MKSFLINVIYAVLSLYYKLLRRPLVYIISFHDLRVSQRLMSNCPEKFDAGEGGSHGLEARDTGVGGPLLPPPTP